MGYLGSESFSSEPKMSSEDRVLTDNIESNMQDCCTSF